MKLTSKQFFTGTFLVMVAASLWAFDGVIRYPLTTKYSAVVIVFIEHLLGCLIFLPFLKGTLRELKQISKKDLALFFLLALVSGLLGTVLFTESINQAKVFFDFTTPTLVQKLQPIFVIILARLVFKEKLSLTFKLLLPVVIIASLMVTFGDSPINLAGSGKLNVYLLALGATIAWGTGTILSKNLLQKYKFTTVTNLRFILTTGLTLVACVLTGQTGQLISFKVADLLPFVLITLTTGAAALLIYYYGLQRTEAKIATIAELSFPITAVLIATTAINPYGIQQLTPSNIYGICILILAVLVVSLENKISPKPVISNQ